MPPSFAEECAGVSECDDLLRGCECRRHASKVVYNKAASLLPSCLSWAHSSLQAESRSRMPGWFSVLLIHRISASSSSATKYDDSRDKIDSKVAFGADKRSVLTQRCSAFRRMT